MTNVYGAPGVIDVFTTGRADRGSRLRAARRALAWWPVAIVAVAMVLAAFPGVVAPHSPNTINLTARLLAPGSVVDGTRYWLGTDELGRDLASRVIWGARNSVVVAVLAVLVAGVGGGALGVIAGVYRKIVGVGIMRLADLVLSVPFFLLAILVVSILGPSVRNEVLVLAIVRWPRYTRVAYGQTVDASNREFVRSEVALGARRSRVVLRHILPEVLPALIVVATLEVGIMITFEAGLSFIGLGVPPPTATWGAMLSEGQQFVSTAWWISTFPGIALFLLVLSVNRIGDRVRDRLDPRSKRMR